MPECPYRVTILADVLEDIRLAVDEAFYAAPRGGVEIGGVFFGVSLGDSLNIQAFRPTRCQYLHGPSFTLSSEDKLGLSGVLALPQSDPELAGLTVIGWYHSHHRSEIFLSPVDLQLYQEFFPEPWQIALVLRPANLRPTRAGFFFRDRSGAIKSDAPVQEFTMSLPGYGLELLPPEAENLVVKTQVPPAVPAGEPVHDIPPEPLTVATPVAPPASPAVPPPPIASPPTGPVAATTKAEADSVAPKARFPYYMTLQRLSAKDEADLDAPRIVRQVDKTTLPVVRPDQDPAPAHAKERIDPPVPRTARQPDKTPIPDPPVPRTARQPDKSPIPDPPVPQTARQPDKSPIPDPPVPRTARQPDKSPIPDPPVPRTARQPDKSPIPDPPVPRTARQPEKSPSPDPPVLRTARQPEKTALPDPPVLRTARQPEKTALPDPPVLRTARQADKSPSPDLGPDPANDRVNLPVPEPPRQPERTPLPDLTPDLANLGTIPPVPEPPRQPERTPLPDLTPDLANLGTIPPVPEPPRQPDETPLPDLTPDLANLGTVPPVPEPPRQPERTPLPDLTPDLANLGTIPPVPEPPRQPERIPLPDLTPDFTRVEADPANGLAGLDIAEEETVAPPPPLGLRRGISEPETRLEPPQRPFPTQSFGTEGNGEFLERTRWGRIRLHRPKSNSDRRSARREPGDGLIAFYWDGGRPRERRVRDISWRGAFVETDFSWTCGTHMILTLQMGPNEGADKSPPDTIIVRAEVIRTSLEGMALKFSFRDLSELRMLLRFLSKWKPNSVPRMEDNGLDRRPILS